MLSLLGTVSRGIHNGPAIDILSIDCPTTQSLTKSGCLEPLVIELFTFIPRRLGKHQNCHVVCAQADFEGFVLWDLKFLMRLSKAWWVEAPAFSLLWLWLLLCGIGSVLGPGIPTYCLCGKKKKKKKKIQKEREPEINVATLKTKNQKTKTKKHVSWVYGGSMCAKCVHDRIKRAFLIEEQKIVVKVLKAQAESES